MSLLENKDNSTVVSFSPDGAARSRGVFKLTIYNKNTPELAMADVALFTLTNGSALLTVSHDDLPELRHALKLATLAVDRVLGLEKG